MEYIYYLICVLLIFFFFFENIYSIILKGIKDIFFNTKYFLFYSHLNFLVYIILIKLS